MNGEGCQPGEALRAAYAEAVHRAAVTADPIDPEEIKKNRTFLAVVRIAFVVGMQYGRRKRGT